MNKSNTPVGEAIQLGVGNRRSFEVPGFGWFTMEIVMRHGASEEEVAAALDQWERTNLQMGSRIDSLIGAAMGQMGGAASYSPPPEQPASEKQRNFVASLADRLQWNSEQLAVYAQEQGIDLASLTKSGASILIDGMQRMERGEAPAHPTEREAAGGAKSLADQAVF